MNTCKTCKKPLGIKEPIIANPKGRTAQCIPCAKKSGINLSGIQRNPGAFVPVRNAKKPPRRGLKIHTKGKFYRERMASPKQFDKFRTTKTRTGHRIIHGRRTQIPKRGSRWGVQAILHPRIPSEARKLHGRGYKFPSEANPRMQRVRGVPGMVLDKGEMASLPPGLLYRIVQIHQEGGSGPYGPYVVERHEAGVRIMKGGRPAFFILSENIVRAQELMGEMEKKYQYRHPASISSRRMLTPISPGEEPRIYKFGKPSRKTWRVKESFVALFDVGDMFREMIDEEESMPRMIRIPDDATVVGTITSRLDAETITTNLVLFNDQFYAEMAEGRGVALDVVKSKEDKTKEIPDRIDIELFSDDTRVAGYSAIRHHGFSPWIQSPEGTQSAPAMRYKEEAIQWLIDHGIPLESPDVPIPLPWEEGGENVQLAPRRRSFIKRGEELL